MAKYLQHGNFGMWFHIIGDRGPETPNRWYGLQSTGTENESESEELYRDDGNYWHLQGKSSFKITAKVSQLPAKFVEECMGWLKDDNGAWVVGNGKKKDCVIVVGTTILDGDSGAEVPQLDIFYQCTPNDPKIESETDEDKPTVSELEIEFTAKKSKYVFDSNNVAVTHGRIKRIPTNAAFFDNFETELLKPTTAIAAYSTNIYEDDNTTIKKEVLAKKGGK